MNQVRSKHNRFFQVNLNSGRAVSFLGEHSTVSGITDDEMESEELKRHLATGFVVRVQTPAEEAPKPKGKIRTRRAAE